MSELEVIKIVDYTPPNLTINYDMFGGVDIKLDDFVYVHINYDYRYTDNFSRAELANKIAKLLGGESK
jgi:hypothetical protein